MGLRLVPSAVWFMPVLTTPSASWRLRWAASSSCLKIHLPSEKFSAELFFPPLLYGSVPCATRTCFLWLLWDFLGSWSARSYAQVLLWKGVCACTFLFLSKLRPLLCFLFIYKVKMTCSSLHSPLEDGYCVWLALSSAWWNFTCPLWFQTWI